MLSGNLHKSRQKRGRFFRMIVDEGEEPWTSGRFYITVVQSALLFGSETWVLTPHTLREMWGIHNKAARRITVRINQRLWNRRWYCPPIGEALTDAGIETIGIYVTCHHNTMTQYINTHTISDFMVAKEHRNGFPDLLRLC